MARNEEQLPSPILSGKPSGVRGLSLSPSRSRHLALGGMMEAAHPP